MERKMSVSATNLIRASASAAPAQAQPARFSRPRFALLVLLGVYPLITVLLYLILPLTDGWPIWQRTLLIAPIMVTIMVWGLIPGVQKLFRSFINPVGR
jgi:antibiotic biosynthesis monooxygenase (ABM) superfamily enzyme